MGRLQAQIVPEKTEMIVETRRLPSIGVHQFIDEYRVNIIPLLCNHECLPQVRSLICLCRRKPGGPTVVALGDRCPANLSDPDWAMVTMFSHDLSDGWHRPAI